MSRSFNRLSLFITLSAAGCAWQPETIHAPAAGRPYSEIYVEIDSSRSLTGVEHTVRCVYPDNDDSMQAIIFKDYATSAWNEYAYNYR